MSRERLALLAYRAAAWVAPVVLGVALAYQWVVNPWPVALIATGTAALGVLVALIVDDYRMLQLRRTWSELLVEYRTAAVDAGREAVRAGVFADMLREAVLELHRPYEGTLGDDGLGDAARTYYEVIFDDEGMPADHECVAEALYIPGLGFMRCDEISGAHVVEACVHCCQPWPCPTAAAVMPRTCKHCGCTDLLACDGGCSWVSDDECSACVPLTVTITVDDEQLERATTGSTSREASLAEDGAA
jgi:hypothetical protein